MQTIFKNSTADVKPADTSISDLVKSAKRGNRQARQALVFLNEQGSLGSGNKGKPTANVSTLTA